LEAEGEEEREKQKCAVISVSWLLQLTAVSLFAHLFRKVKAQLK